MSLPSHRAYVDSGVAWLGQIPSHWHVFRLKDIAKVINGYPFDSKLFEVDGTHSLVRIRDLDARETATRYSGEFVADAAVTSADVLIGMDGEFNVGRWLGAEPALLNQRMCCVRASSHPLSQFLLHALPIPLKAINDVTYSTTVKHLSSLDVEKLRIGLPDSDELAAIAAFLDYETAKIDGLIAEQEKLIALLAEKRQATISHAVTRGLNPQASMKDSGVPWLGEVPAHWEVKQLKHLANPGSLITYGIVQAGPHVEGGIPYIKTSDMAGDTLPLDGYSRTSREIDAAYARSKVVTHDIVIAIRATVGKCLPVPPELAGVNLTQGTAKVTPSDAADSTYLLWTLRSTPVQNYFDHMAKGATFKEITLDALRRTPVPLPPKGEQQTIAKFIDDAATRFESLRGNAMRAVELLKERRSALIAAAVTGQIDVRSFTAA